MRLNLLTGETDNDYVDEVFLAGKKALYNADIRIEGEKLRIALDGGEGLGVFFVNANGRSHSDYPPPDAERPENAIVHVPTLRAGQYTLRVVTRYSNETIILNILRIIEYERLLTV